MATSPKCTRDTPSSPPSAMKQRAVATFDGLNEKYYDGAWRAQFVTGMMFPIMMFIGNLGYVAVAVIGGLLVTRRTIAIGDVQAFIQYSRQFSMPITQLSSIANSIQLTIASAERVFELLDEPEEPAEPAAAATLPAPRGEVQFDRRRLQLQARRAADRGHEHQRGRRTNGGHRRPHRRGQDDARQPVDAVLRRQCRQHPRRRHRHPRAAARRTAADVRHGAAGHVAVFRQHSRQHRLRPRRRE